MLVATKYGCMTQGTTEVAFTVLDPLGYLDEIPSLRRLRDRRPGHRLASRPTAQSWNKAKPVLQKTAGVEMRHHRHP